MSKKQSLGKNLISKIYSDPHYKGKHVVIIAGKIHTAKTGNQAARIFRQLTQQFPKTQPTIAYIPKADSLILFL